MGLLSGMSADDGTNAWAPPEVTPRQQDGIANNCRRLDKAQCTTTNSGVKQSAKLPGKRNGFADGSRLMSGTNYVLRAAATLRCDHRAPCRKA